MQWSAFPSDHAALYVALATGICLVSWRLGLIALIWTTLIVLFPRLYVGAHHPSDLIVGSLIGAVCVCLACTRPVRARLQWLIEWADRWPSFFYPLLFLVT